MCTVGMLIGFCKKSVHSFFNLHNYHATTDQNASPAATKCGLGLITDPPRPCRNILIDRWLPHAQPVKEDQFLLDNIIGNRDGLTSCTETLGSESSVETKFDGMDLADDHLQPSTTCQSNYGGKRREERKFPPPLSSLSRNGQPSFYLRPLRRGGRLKLTEVKLQRPEMLTAHREDGRLTLQLVQDDDCFCVKEEEEEEEDQEEEEEEEEEDDDDDDDYGEDQKAVGHVDEEKASQREVEEGSEGECWSYKRVSGEAAARRCEEVVRMKQGGNDYHHHNLHVCVTAM